MKDAEGWNVLLFCLHKRLLHPKRFSVAPVMLAGMAAENFLLKDE
jgi:hypothetical protein